MTRDDHELRDLLAEEPALRAVARAVEDLGAGGTVSLTGVPAKRRLVRKSAISRRWALVTMPAAVCLAVLVVAPAFGGARAVLDLFSSKDAPVPAWDLPGKPVGAPNQDPLITVAASQAAVDVESVREVAKAGSDERQLSLLVGRGSDGQVWLARKGPGSISQFTPLANVPTHAVATFEIFGGPRPNGNGYVVGWQTLVGFARSDMTRVVVTLQNGREEVIPLNPWRGFGYSATSKERLPVSVHAYRADGKVVEKATVLSP
jgi:hypothetical protein